MYISELFTVVGYLHTTGFKNRRGTFCVKCTSIRLDLYEAQSAPKFRVKCLTIKTQGGLETMVFNNDLPNLLTIKMSA